MDLYKLRLHILIKESKNLFWTPSRQRYSMNLRIDCEKNNIDQSFNICAGDDEAL